MSLTTCPAGVARAGSASFLDEYQHESEFEPVSSEFNSIRFEYLVTVLLVVIAIARLVFHTFNLQRIVPDSALTIIIGVLVGTFLSSTGTESAEVQFDEEIFFHYLLPWIILSDGYFTDVSMFLKNMRVILILALIGTLINTLAIGYIMYAVADWVGLAGFRAIDGLVFGSLIAAVDPVAALSVFEEVHVNDNLFITVFGESTLNDGIAITLFRIFAALAYRRSDPRVSDETGETFLIGLSQFVLTFFGGIIVGYAFGLIAAFFGMFTRNLGALMPLLVLAMGYLSYLTAESFEISGIIAILVTGMTMQLYMPGNMSRDTATGVHTLLHTASDTAETIVFIVLGIEVILSIETGWNTGFVVIALLACLIIRFLSVYGLVALVNPFRERDLQFSMADRFILSYGGLRGAIAFALATILLDDEQLCVDDDAGQAFAPFRFRDLFVSATIAIVVFTILVQGTTLNPLLQWLHVRRKNEDESEADGKELVRELVDSSAEHIIEFMHHLVGLNTHNAASWYLHRLDIVLDHFFYQENIFRVRHAFEVLEDDIEATTRRLVTNIRAAQKDIAEDDELTDEERVHALRAHVENAVSAAAGGVQSRLNHATNVGAMAGAWKSRAVRGGGTRPQRRGWGRRTDEQHASQRRARMLTNELASEISRGSIQDGAFSQWQQAQQAATHDQPAMGYRGQQSRTATLSSNKTGSNSGRAAQRWKQLRNRVQAKHVAAAWQANRPAKNQKAMFNRRKQRYNMHEDQHWARSQAAKGHYWHLGNRQRRTDGERDRQRAQIEGDSRPNGTNLTQQDHDASESGYRPLTGGQVAAAEHETIEMQPQETTAQTHSSLAQSGGGAAEVDVAGQRQQPPNTATRRSAGTHDFNVRIDTV